MPSLAAASVRAMMIEMAPGLARRRRPWPPCRAGRRASCRSDAHISWAATGPRYAPRRRPHPRSCGPCASRSAPRRSRCRRPPARAGPEARATWRMKKQTSSSVITPRSGRPIEALIAAPERYSASKPRRAAPAGRQAVMRAGDLEDSAASKQRAEARAGGSRRADRRRRDRSWGRLRDYRKNSAVSRTKPAAPGAAPRACSRKTRACGPRDARR